MIFNSDYLCKNNPNVGGGLFFWASLIQKTKKKNPPPGAFREFPLYSALLKIFFNVYHSKQVLRKQTFGKHAARFHC